MLFFCETRKTLPMGLLHSIVFMMIKIYPTVGIVVIANYEMIYTA